MRRSRIAVEDHVTVDSKNSATSAQKRQKISLGIPKDKALNPDSDNFADKDSDNEEETDRKRNTLNSSEKS